MSKTLTVEGMHCPKCVAHVKKALEKLDGVESAEVDLDAKTAVVEGSASDDAMKAAVADAGFEVAAIA